MFKECLTNDIKNVFNFFMNDVFLGLDKYTNNTFSTLKSFVDITQRAILW